ncbi:uncharacterized protein LOC132732555 [Ruditapes philippinarum]|uniref:uncharacterized protein LOC132732555 n=1 Tax=Ruditapes philippinarum TaxID=129788 RepID=UPI00295BC3B3|nr:uncharacterized protein LOC132732555 [Ruditapes philippinarum]
MTEMKSSNYLWSLTGICLLVQVVIMSNDMKACWMTPFDAYRKFKCVKSSVMTLPFNVCAMKCCLQHRCIGLYHKEASDECYLINATEKEENCADLDWNSWKAYKKTKDLGGCSQYLLGNKKVPARLNFVPSDNDDIGGFNVTGKYKYTELSKLSRVRGFATQGRWRNETVDSCCDERVTYFYIYYSTDYKKWFWADKKARFEANVIPDAGNEIVFNVFQTPVEARYLKLYPADHHGQKIVRFNVIGCDL